jgi:ABC-type multidrug transport system ATPase subunit
VILSTHIVSDAEATATEIALIRKGQLLKHAVPEVLLQAVEGKVWQWIIPSADLNMAKENWLISSTARRSDGIHLRVVSELSPGPDSQPVAPTLEDAYLYSISADNRSKSEGNRE